MEAEFDWDRELRVSERALQALALMRTAMKKYGSLGQPLWPVVPSSLWVIPFPCQAGLQNEALLHNRLFMDVGAAPPLYLRAPGRWTTFRALPPTPPERAGPPSRRSRLGKSCRPRRSSWASPPISLH